MRLASGDHVTPICNPGPEVTGWSDLCGGDGGSEVGAARPLRNQKAVAVTAKTRSSEAARTAAFRCRLMPPAISSALACEWTDFVTSAPAVEVRLRSNADWLARA